MSFFIFVMPSNYKEKHNHLLLDTSYAMAKTIFQANDGFLMFLQQPLFLNKLCRKLQKQSKHLETRQIYYYFKKNSVCLDY